MRWYASPALEAQLHRRVTHLQRPFAAALHARTATPPRCALLTDSPRSPGLSLHSRVHQSLSAPTLMAAAAARSVPPLPRLPLRASMARGSRRGLSSTSPTRPSRSLARSMAQTLSLRLLWVSAVGIATPPTLAIATPNAIHACTATWHSHVSLAHASLRRLPPT